MGEDKNVAEKVTEGVEAKVKIQETKVTFEQNGKKLAMSVEILKNIVAVPPRLLPRKNKDDIPTLQGAIRLLIRQIEKELMIAWLKEYRENEKEWIEESKTDKPESELRIFQKIRRTINLGFWRFLVELQYKSGSVTDFKSFEFTVLEAEKKDKKFVTKKPSFTNPKTKQSFTKKQVLRRLNGKI